MEKNPQKASSSAALALAAAVGSLAGTFTGHPIIGLIAGLLCLPFAILGLALSVSPKIGGGLMSIGALVLGAPAILLALLGVIGVVIF